ncbi:MAG: tRNA pseudouridine(55) synthase TruB [Planctomycetota bacterium]|jgi:tRNA pseudouridine55 synthase
MSQTKASANKKGAPKLPDPDGILLIDKPSGMTSHDVVYKVRKTHGYKKVGHAGTLDPMATGVLVLLIGRGTKSQAQFLNDDKAYSGVIRLGSATSTYDREGEVTDRAEGKLSITREQVLAAMKKLTGDIEQVPPMVSAIKHKGKPLYKYARKGEEIERKARKVTIQRFELLSYEDGAIGFAVDCTKGTYVRSLAHDMGMDLGCFAHLEELRRTRSGAFTEDKLHKLEDVLKSRREEVLYMLELIPEKPRPPA